MPCPSPISPTAKTIKKTFVPQQSYEYFWTELFAKIFPEVRPKNAFWDRRFYATWKETLVRQNHSELHRYSTRKSNNMSTKTHNIAHTAHIKQNTPGSIMLPIDSQHKPKCAEGNTIHASLFNTFCKCKESFLHSIPIESHLRQTCPT